MSSENLNLKVKANKAYSQEPNFENPQNVSTPYLSFLTAA